MPMRKTRSIISSSSVIAEHRRRQDLDEAVAYMPQTEQRHLEPAHARGAQLVDGRDEVEAGEDRGEARG